MDAFSVHIKKNSGAFPKHTKTNFGTLTFYISHVHPTTLKSLEYFLSTIDRSVVKDAKVTLHNIGGDDAEKIFDLFETYPCVTDLSISDITVWSQAFHLKKFIYGNQATLKNVTITSVEFRDATDTDLYESLGSLVYLESLRIVDVWFNSQLMMELATAMSRCKTLRSLSLRRCELTAKRMRHVVKIVASIPLLTTLDLAGNPIGNVGCDIITLGIKNHPTLVSLDLSSCDIGTAGARTIFEAMESNTTIEILDLERNRIAAGAARALARTIARNQHLVILDLSYNRMGTKAIRHVMKTLKLNSTLCNLSLSGMEMEVNTDEIVKMLDSLEDKNNTICNIDEFTPAISDHPLLKRNIKNNPDK